MNEQCHTHLETPFNLEFSHPQTQTNHQSITICNNKCRNYYENDNARMYNNTEDFIQGFCTLQIHVNCV